MADYIPKDEPSLAIWLGELQAKIVTHGPTVGLIAGDITEISDACSRTYTNIGTVNTKKNELQSSVTKKNTDKTVDIKIIREYAKRIKAHKAYTTEIGEALGIIGTDPEDDLENSRPEITNCMSHPAYVRIKFKKNGFDAVNVYTRLKGQSGWTFLARDTNSPYDDHRPLVAANTPETREYMCIGVVHDDEVGLQSDIVSVVFGG